MKVSISDPTLVSFDGLYDITHTNGYAVETNKLLICHVGQPASKFVSQTEPFVIDADLIASGLTIDLNPYTLTNESDCGSLVYTASTISGYDPFSAGNGGSISTTQLTFSNLGAYPIGVTQIQVQVSTTTTSSPAYSITFNIANCMPPASLASRFVVHVNTETAKTFDYTNYAGAGLDPTACELDGSKIWLIDGPPPSNAPV